LKLPKREQPPWQREEAIWLRAEGRKKGIRGNQQNNPQSTNSAKEPARQDLRLGK